MRGGGRSPPEAFCVPPASGFKLGILDFLLSHFGVSAGRPLIMADHENSAHKRGDFFRPTVDLSDTAVPLYP